jgi:hypothetical protein
MTNNNGDESRTLEIRKYQNRRYYDSTRSRHLNLQQDSQADHRGHANSCGLFRGHDPPKICAYAKKMLARFGNSCDAPLRSSGITRSPHQENKEEARK